MRTGFSTRLLAGAVMWAAALCCAETPELLQLSGDLERVHDPVIIRAGDLYYVFSTNRAPNGHIPIRCSNDLHEWRLCGAVFKELPSWVSKDIPGARSLWAPDISKVDGRYYLYYSASTFGSNRSAIGLAINKTLDIKSPKYQWVDQGPVIQSYKEDPYNCIDPNLVLDQEGRAWLVFGSFWTGIKMRRLDRATGKLSNQDTTLYSVASRTGGPKQPGGAIEGPFVIHHDDYYYLFASFDFCCRGARSTYNLRVGRSRKVTGPYVDRDGKPMMDGGGTLLLQGNSRWRGPGHNGILQRPEGDITVFHAYDGTTGRSYLQISTIAWEDDWPRLGALPDSEPDGKRVFSERCAGCHGSDARGGGKAPGLAANPRLSGLSRQDLAAIVERGFPATGMPAFNLPREELDAIASYVRSLNSRERREVSPPRRLVKWGPPKPGDWLTYNGKLSANRYSDLREINVANVAALRLKWIFPIPHFGLEVTPLAAGGVMYVTGPNQVFAIDASTGAQIWKYSRPQTQGLDGDAALGTNRGVAIRDDKVFFVTDNAHLLALDRSSGRLVWETVMPEEPQHYGGTVAPLVVKDTVIAGVAGADHGIRGFIGCYQADTGKMLWRHWTVPRRGEPGSETWEGSEPLVGGGSTWLTGSYDEQTNTLYWPTGNPYPDSKDEDRGGDNLYTNCILALDPDTGKSKWHFQFTPHDVRDRDATEPPVLVDAVYGGKPRKLLLHADRNGFFYVLDRTSGALLLAKPFLRRVDWASGIDADGRPRVTDPRGCPDDAANWSSTAYSPVTGLYYFLALEECTGSPMGYPDQTGQRFLRAVDINTGEVVWEVPQPGPAKAKTWSGVLATAGGLVFYGQPNGGFSAVDERDGKTLWRFPTNVPMKASPMTFASGGKQYVAVAAGPNILCFGL